jgi:hypothetical protein
MIEVEIIIILAEVGTSDQEKIRFVRLFKPKPHTFVYIIKYSMVASCISSFSIILLQC